MTSRAITLRRGAADDAERLREIAAAAKAYWAYDPDRVRAWARTIEPTGAGSAREVFVAEASGSVVAWVSIEAREDGAWWMDDLWVEPVWMGHGVGSTLVRHALACCRKHGGARLEWEAEPNAVGFYEKIGARHIRDSAPTIWGRILPVMGVDLREHDGGPAADEPAVTGGGRG